VHSARLILDPYQWHSPANTPFPFFTPHCELRGPISGLAGKAIAIHNKARAHDQSTKDLKDISGCGTMIDISVPVAHVLTPGSNKSIL
jgi:hypothetical protein